MLQNWYQHLVKDSNEPHEGPETKAQPNNIMVLLACCNNYFFMLWQYINILWDTPHPPHVTLWLPLDRCLTLCVLLGVLCFALAAHQQGLYIIRRRLCAVGSVFSEQVCFSAEIYWVMFLLLPSCHVPSWSTTL